MSMADSLTGPVIGRDVCRVCLRDANDEGSPKHLFRARKKMAGATVSCADMLSACSPYTVTESDGLPLNICCRCYKKLCSAYKFRLLCESSYVAFLSRTSAKIKLDPVKLEKCETQTQGEIEENKSEFPSQNLLLNYCDDVKVEDGQDFNDEFEDEVKYSPNNCYDDVKSESETNCQDGHRKEKSKKSLKKITKMKKKARERKVNLTCALCPRTFKWKHLLISHQDSHFGIKRYYCEICKKDYRNERDHKKFHRRGHKFECDHCAKRFNTKAKLTIHLETHSTERERFFCDISGCDRIFLSINGLDRHKMSHLGLKNFICQVCSKCFIDKYQLEVHLRIHTNDRRYNCGFCDKKFITTSARNAHEKWHTKVKNYQCQYCEKAFVSSSGLKRHILCHTKEQHQECRFCGKKFTRFDNKKRHEMTTHQLNEKPLLPFV